MLTTAKKATCHTFLCALAFVSVADAQVVEKGRTFDDLTASHPCASGLENRIARVTDCDAADDFGDGGGAFQCWAYCDGSAPWTNLAIGGTVTSVGVAVPAEWSVSGSPVSTSGTITITEATQTANTCYAGPTSGSAAAPGFRSLVAADLPAPLKEYDPRRPPSSCAVCEEATNDTESLTWSWGNQDGATVADTYDSILVTGDGTDELHVRGAASPSGGNADITFTAHIEASSNLTATDGCLLGMITGGTVATPTSMEVVYFTNESPDGFRFWLFTSYALAGASQHGATGIVDVLYPTTREYWLQLRYTDSTRATTAWHSWTGLDFLQIGSSATAAADPTDFFVGVRDAGTCRFASVRARTDANRNDAGE